MPRTGNTMELFMCLFVLPGDLNSHFLDSASPQHCSLDSVDISSAFDCNALQPQTCRSCHSARPHHSLKLSAFRFTRHQVRLTVSINVFFISLLLAFFHGFTPGFFLLLTRLMFCTGSASIRHKEQGFLYQLPRPLLGKYRTLITAMYTGFCLDKG